MRYLSLFFLVACSEKQSTSPSDSAQPIAEDSAAPPIDDSPASWAVGTQRVDDAPDGIQVRGADLLIGPDGTVFVSWVDYRNGDKDTFVRTSEDGGRTWAEATRVDGDEIEAMAGGGQQPYLLLGEDTLYVLMTAQDFEGAATILIYESPLGETLDFSGPTPIGQIHGSSSVAFGKGVVAADGDVWVAWQAYMLDDEYVETGFMVTARQSNGYQPEFPTADVPGMPCECCRLDIQQTRNGDTLLTYRNNDADIRDQYVLRASGDEGGFNQAVLGSETHPEIAYCPAQGPRIAQRPDDSLVMLWSDFDRIHGATSADNGQTWVPHDNFVTAGVIDERFEGDPTIAITDDDRLLMTIETSTSSAVLLQSDEGLGDFVPVTELTSDDGGFAQPTTVRAGGGHAAVIGVVDRASVWLYIVE
jgi:hypothetical protein